MLGVAALTVSLLALMASTFLTFRQVRIMREANYIPVVVELTSAYRSITLYDDTVYVTTRLKAEHDPELGISGLPEPARAALLNVAYYYQSFSWLIDAKILRKEATLDTIHERIILTWPIIEPYVATERKKFPGPILSMLENMYKKLASKSTGQDVHRGDPTPSRKSRAGIRRSISSARNS